MRRPCVVCGHPVLRKEAGMRVAGRIRHRVYADCVRARRERVARNAELLARWLRG